jgi:putative effector of murein hydrolase LrgA (UPF0299 family)
MRVSAEMRDAFIVQVLANLVTVAILYLVANGAGLVADNTAGVAIAAVVITWALYGVLLQREILKPNAIRPGAAFILALVLLGLALVFEVVALLRSNDWWHTIGITLLSLVVGTVPMVIINAILTVRAVNSRHHQETTQ